MHLMIQFYLFTKINKSTFLYSSSQTPMVKCMLYGAYKLWRCVSRLRENLVTRHQQELKVNLESLVKMAVKDYLVTRGLLNQVKL